MPEKLTPVALTVAESQEGTPFVLMNKGGVPPDAVQDATNCVPGFTVADGGEHVSRSAGPGPPPPDLPLIVIVIVCCTCCPRLSRSVTTKVYEFGGGLGAIPLSVMFEPVFPLAARKDGRPV